VVAALLVAEGQVDEVPEGTELSEAESKLYASPADRDCSEAALALARQKLDVQIYQLVRFLKDGKPAPMRKRDGNIYALMDLLHEIGHKLAPEGSVDEQLSAGRDVARFFYLMRSHDTTFDFDLDLAEKQSDENPVFYVQYAHARVCSVLAKAADAGIRPDHAADLSLLTHPRELALIKKLADLPYEVERASFDYGVHRLATYAIELARAYHAFYDVCRVIQDSELALSQARVALCDAVRVGLRSTCELLGISSPERM
jgi:arginyl-tRNA synthetase